MNQPMFYVHTGSGRPIPFRIAEHLPHGMHYLRITVVKANGYVVQNAFTFFGTEADIVVVMDTHDQIGADIDGMKFQPRPVINVLADSLYRMVRRLLDEHQPRVPYIMD